MKIKQAAFLIHCPGCDGSGNLSISTTEFRCIGCNGWGMKIMPVSDKRMKAYLEKREMKDV